MIILALDTCLAACSVAVVDGARVLARRVELMSRGHQERLAPLVAEAMAEAGLKFDQLQRVGVTVGPGSFTGLRVGLAFAKGLGHALSIPVIGIGVLEALACGNETTPGLIVAALEAKRGQVFLQAFADGAAVMAPEGLAIEVAIAWAAQHSHTNPITLVGTGAPHLGAAFPNAEVIVVDHVDPVVVAQLARKRPVSPPRPLYLRAPDAKLPGGRELPA
jgi:tRNA threonylcarbamoyladenosine biosynthesis protein TsaB